MGWLTEDVERLRRFRKGDAEILQEVYLHYAPLVGQKLAAGGGVQRITPSDLADIIQETFLRAFAEPARRAYNADQPYFPYLLAIARNLAIDQYRKRARNPEVSGKLATCDDAGPVDRPSSDPGPEAAALHRQLLVLYERFLAAQDEQSRTVWRLRIEKGLSRREIQEQTGLSAKKIRILERKLRKSLYEMLRQSDYPVPDSGDVVVMAMLLWLLTNAP